MVGGKVDRPSQPDTMLKLCGPVYRSVGISAWIDVEARCTGRLRDNGEVKKEG